jgi:DNA repair protein RecN (Recombination protein N)
MLKLIKIKDFALIESLEIELESGMASITGETGVGKSLILDAISSLMGSKCNTMNIRSGAKKYQLEAIFDISKNSCAPSVRGSAISFRYIKRSPYGSYFWWISGFTKNK